GYQMHHVNDSAERAVVERRGDGCCDDDDAISGRRRPPASASRALIPSTSSPQSMETNVILTSTSAVSVFDTRRPAAFSANAIQRREERRRWAVGSVRPNDGSRTQAPKLPM